jgi:hypothetical protein
MEYKTCCKAGGIDRGYMERVILYRERYDITIHEAAAMAIARRAMGYRKK